MKKKITKKPVTKVDTSHPAWPYNVGTSPMYRTLVRVERYSRDILEGVWLIVPSRDSKNAVFCPRNAIPPHIYTTMAVGKRYHVGCNIGAERNIDLCFDGWELN